MLKFLLFLIRPAPGAQTIDPDQQRQWLRDPLSHPVLDAMSQRELGDLPFRR